ncbi:hypothetical protein D9757_001370 [Collybiopsis confluens]|uniref:Rhodanese domain-containing protein n=1 Tax=Collybiopsis confluens TaxID=2823264 RepID=A0A8H5MFK4_9AGAR|nr:hypothetical protein D9757_001370 [Collybiopsis confluens]
MTLSLSDYRRYGRQMILNGFGLQGQLRLSYASVVVVGAGGLGCPALQYLGASGIGTTLHFVFPRLSTNSSTRSGRIGIIDHDRVELSNLQRQILHNEETVGMPKAQSAAMALKRINSSLVIDTIAQALTPENAVSLLEPYDIILDCTDNPPTRYLISDTAVVLGKPLVSGAAQKFEAPEHAGTCEETGILGAVTGIIGNLQALETIKILTGLHDAKPTLTLFSALNTPQFRSIKMRSRKSTCPACGQESQKIGAINDIDYVQFCGGATPDWESLGLAESSNPEHRIRVRDLKNALDAKEPINLIDVRPKIEFDICHLSESTHISLSELVASPSSFLSSNANIPTYIICRLGNDSQIAAEALRELKTDRVVKDVVGGLRAWSKDIDLLFPIY